MVDGASGSASRGSYQGVSVGRRAIEGKDAASNVLREHALHLVQHAGPPFASRQDLDAVAQLGFADGMGFGGWLGTCCGSSWGMRGGPSV